jgi:hypothetical protein
MYGMSGFICVSQNTPSIVPDDKRHDFHLCQKGGRKAEIGWASIPTRLNQTTILDQIINRIKLFPVKRTAFCAVSGGNE